MGSIMTLMQAIGLWDGQAKLFAVFLLPGVFLHPWANKSLPNSLERQSLRFTVQSLL
jgi:hypothetical protein